MKVGHKKVPALNLKLRGAGTHNQTGLVEIATIRCEQMLVTNNLKGAQRFGHAWP